MQSLNQTLNKEELSHPDASRLVSYRPPSFSYLNYDVWNEDKTTFMIAYEDLRDHIIKFGIEGVEESAINFIRDCNPTEEQRATLIKLFQPTRFATAADRIPGVCGPLCDCLVPNCWIVRE